MKDEDRPRDSWAMSLFAAVAFISWGLYANWHHGWQARLQVSLTQGGISLLSTYFSAELIVLLVSRMRNLPAPTILGGLASYFVIYLLILGGHFVAGTPEFWPTVIPGMISGTFFCFGYAYRVSRKLSTAGNPSC
jgi:hypothetical protein